MMSLALCWCVCPQQVIKDTIKAENPCFNIPNVAGIRQVHQVKCNCNSSHSFLTSQWSKLTWLCGKVQYRKGSRKSQYSHHMWRNVHLRKGNWYVVDYNGERFPGEVLSNLGGVFVKKRAGSFWKWPSSKDILFQPDHRGDLIPN